MNLMLDLEGTGLREAGVRRHFVGWEEPFLPAVAALLAGEYGGGGELGLGDVVVVMAGARAGRRLKELLLAEAERAGVRLVPPRMVTVGDLPELLWEPEAPLASGALARRAWAGALRAMPAERLRWLAASPPAQAYVLGWTRLARTIEGLHREVAGAGLTFAEVAERTGEDPVFDDEVRWRVLEEVQARYASLLESFGFSDTGLGRIAALDGRLHDPGADLWLVGVLEMPGVLRSMLRSIRAAAPIRALVHAPESESDAFDELGCVVPAAWARREIEIPDERLAVRGRPADQADEAVNVLASLDGRFAADEITIAVADEEILPYLEQRLGSAGVPVRRSTGPRVGRTPALRLLAALADYLDGNRYQACAALVRHPDLWRWLRRAGGTGSPLAGALGTVGGWVSPMDRHFSERLPARLRPGRVDGSDARAAVVGALCRALGALDSPSLLGRLRGDRRIADWMPDILAILLEVYGGEELDRKIPEQRELIEALSNARGSAAELHHLPPSADETVDAATAIRLLLDDVAERRIPPSADDAAVELLGWLEVHLDDAPVVIVTGFNEGALPESVSAHPYLPDAVRSRIGLVDNAARYARDAYQLTALLASKTEIRLIAGRQTVRGDPLRPSRLMFAIRDEALAERVQRFYGEAAASGGGGQPEPKDVHGDAPQSAALTPHTDAGSADPRAGALREPGSRFVLPPEPLLAAPEPIRRLSVGRFGDVLTDPYLFALRSVLRLEPLDDAATELDGLRFGSLAHHVLQRFASLPGADSDDPSVLGDVIDRALEQEVAGRHGAEVVPAVRLQVEQLRARLHAFARWQAGWAAEGWRIVGVECDTPADGVELVVDGEPFSITGRIDRIDYNERLGAWAVFDYKTGDRGETPDATHRNGRGDDRTWVSLQLPLYRLILPHVVDAAGDRPFVPGRSDDVRLGYVLLPRDPAGVGASFAEWSETELDDADEAAREVIRFVRRNEFAWNPSAPRRVGDPRLAALLGIGHLEAAMTEDEAEALDG